MTGPRIEWLAERDLEAHAHVGRGRVLRTACDKPAIDVRHAWPALRRCAACETAVDRLTEDEAAPAARQ